MDQEEARHPNKSYMHHDIPYYPSPPPRRVTEGSLKPDQRKTRVVATLFPWAYKPSSDGVMNGPLFDKYRIAPASFDIPP
ncbi:hypothetical protein Nepgr_002641 [Nepenthes gracilis]|uniref:Uncharacterized protein n=1 Tax=Nepenthes gracilis TaxID=150966 RepID=A0AAD3PA71_NEPGR|nr:hypothetical protein Nepgr_002641 [Nepenthes gracilis]